MNTVNTTDLGLNGYSRLNFSLTKSFKTLIISTLLSTLLLFSLSSSAQTTVVLEDISLKVTHPETLAISMSTYPNPASDKIMAEVQGAEQILAADILDLSGKRIYSSPVGSTGSSLKISLTTVPEGTYLLKIRTEKGIVSSKFFVFKS